MNCHNDFTLSEGLLETLAANGCDALPEMLRLLLNAAMLLERQKYSEAGPYERTPERTVHANGFKDKTIQTRMGAIPLTEVASGVSAKKTCISSDAGQECSLCA